jgi:hypothetical protein
MMQVSNVHDTSFNFYGLGSNVETLHDVNFTFSYISALSDRQVSNSSFELK